MSVPKPIGMTWFVLDSDTKRKRFISENSPIVIVEQQTIQNGIRTGNSSIKQERVRWLHRGYKTALSSI